METRRNLVAAARGDEPLDILLRDAWLVNVLTGTIDHIATQQLIPTLTG